MHMAVEMYLLILQFRLLLQGGLAWFAPVCSSWVWISRLHGKTRFLPNILGTVHVDQVHDRQVRGHP